MEIKDRIKTIRASKSLTQQEFADDLGIKKVLIAHWETGRANPGLENLTTICSKYNITADWLLFGKEPTAEISGLVHEDSTSYNKPQSAATEANSLREEIKQLKNELRLNSLKWDKRAQLLEELMQTGFEKMAEALTQHLGAVQKDGSKASGAPVRKK